MIQDHSQFKLTPKQRLGNQLLSSASHVLLRGGSRSGKTFLIMRAIIIRAMKAPRSHHAVFRYRRNSIEDSVWKTAKEVVRLCFPELMERCEWKVSTFTIRLPNGSEIIMLGLDDKERVDKILGQEFSTEFFNECTQIPWPSIETALSRLAEKSSLKLRAWFDCNPTTKLHWTFHLFRKLMKPGTREKVDDPDDYREMQINPDDNRDNISEDYFAVLDRMSAAKRKRFRDGEWADATDGALWSIEQIERERISAQNLPDLMRIVVAVDPSGSSGDGDNDDIGIIVAGKSEDGQFFVLGDRSCNLGPSGWAEQVCAAFHDHEADRVVGEINYGGAMVEAVIRTADPSIPYKGVTASRGKHVRAEPISALYETGKVSHVGTFPDLEDQMCAMTTKGFIGEGSPDRADALVWAITELNSSGRRAPRIRSL